MIIKALNVVVLTLCNNNLRLLFLSFCLSLSLSLPAAAFCIRSEYKLEPPSCCYNTSKMDPLSVHKHLYHGTLVHSNHFLKLTITLRIFRQI